MAIPRRRQPEGTLKFPISYYPKQYAARQNFNREGLDAPTWVGYGGALGGGKSKLMRDLQIERRYKYPGTTGVIMRRVFADVKQNHIDKMFEEYPGLQEFYNVGNHELLIPGAGGSKILFMFAETTQEVMRKFTGPEYFDVFVDQAEQFSEGELRQIKTRTRWPSAVPGATKLGLFFNPGGVGTEFLRDIFWLKHYKEKDKASDFVFTQAFGWDNYQWAAGTGLISEEEYFHLSDEKRFEFFITKTQYGRDLDALPPSLRDGHLLGSFERFAGQYFAGVWDESQCILTPHEVSTIVQPWWTRWASTDWGFAHHAPTLWFATGKIAPMQWQALFGGESQWPVDVVIVYREYVPNNVAEKDLAMEIVERTQNEKLESYFLSPDAFAKKGAANTVAEQIESVFARHRMPRVMPADNDRIGGWRLMYDLFRQTSSLRGRGIDKERAMQGPLLFISANCPETISAIPMPIRDPKNLEDVLKMSTKADDIVDSARYGLKTFLAPRKAPVAVRAQETYDKCEGDMTSKAMVMRKFQQDESKKTRVPRRRRR